LIMCGTQCDDKQRPVFREEEVTLNISSDQSVQLALQTYSV
jgi:hypothetical protein